MASSRSVRGGVVSFLLISALLPMHVTAQGREGASSPLHKAMDKGDYELAGQIATHRDDAEALLVRAELLEMRGERDRAFETLLTALTSATKDEQRGSIIVRLAMIELTRGKWDDAVKRLRAELKRQPKAHQVRLELGRMLWWRGERKEAAQLLDHFGDLFNNGRLKTSTHIGYVAESMHLLGNFQDANYAFNEAYKTNQKDADLLARWGSLYLEKYNSVDAKRSFEEALTINPNHIEALIGMTSLSMQRMSEVENTQNLLERLTALAPGDPDVWVLKGYLALRDSDAEGARTMLERALEIAPEHLDALTLLGAHALQERQPERYEAYKKELLRISPGNGAPLTAIAEYVSNTRMEHDDALVIYNEALSVEPDNAQALMGIGFVLSRTNHDDEALDYFKRSFEIDPYNQRVYFVLEVYDNMMPSYSFKEYERFKLRAKNSEFEIVDMFAAPVIEQAMTLYDKKYDFKPDPNLAIELYPDSTTFSVRSVGVPFIGAHGLCFGPLVTMHSPSEGNFNWRMVLWHEMAHVYHVQLSRARVPRWFTEGLAEYETNVHDPSWRRYYDQDVAVMLARDEVPTVLELSKGFTHTNSQAGVVRAYHLASLSIHFIVQEWGFDSIVTMLEAWGEGLETREVLSRVLKTTPDDFDAKFEAWLSRHLVDFKGQMAFDLERLPSVDELQRQLKLNRRNAQAHLFLAVHAMRSGDREAADKSLAQALNIAPKDPEVHYVALFMRMAQGAPRDAVKHGQEVLAAFKDAYDVRLYLGRAALMMDDVEWARVHLLSAVELNPNGQAAWTDLALLGRNMSDKALYEKAERRLYELSPHDPARASEAYRHAIETEDDGGAMAALKRWQDINPFDVRLHQGIIAQLVQAPISPESNAEIERAYRALIRLEERERAQHYKDALKVFTERGMTEAITSLKVRAREDGITL